MAVRDSKGRYVKGAPSPNPGGAPKRSQVADAVRETLYAALDQGKVDALVATMIRQACDGDRYARQHLLAFLGIDVNKLAVEGNLDTSVTVTVQYVGRDV